LPAGFVKSRFSLDLNPVNYSKSRRFDNRLSSVYQQTFNTSGTFMVSQPILMTTKGRSRSSITFGWQDNKSIVEGMRNQNIGIQQRPLSAAEPAPYSPTTDGSMELQEIEFDYENAGIRYALQRLNTERSITKQFYSVYMARTTWPLARRSWKIQTVMKSFAHGGGRPGRKRGATIPGGT
jgi:hypothetical protein